MLNKIPVHTCSKGGIGSNELKIFLKEQGYDKSQRQIQQDLKTFVEMFDDLHTNGNADRMGWYWSSRSQLLDLPGITPVVALSFKLTQQFLSEIIPDSVQDTLSPYFTKATQVLNALEDENNLANWSDKVRIVPRTLPLLPAKIKPDILHLVFQSLLEEKAIDMDYTSREGKDKQYRINPLGLVFRQSVIYLVGTLWNYDDPLHFALHRMNSCNLSETPLHKIEKFNLDEYIASGSFNYASTDKRIKLTAIFSKQAAIHLAETPLSDDQKMINKRDGRVQVTATIKNSPQLTWWLMGFGSGVEVLKPKALRDEFIQMSTELHAIYQSS